MSDLFRNHIVGFPTRRLICCLFLAKNDSYAALSEKVGSFPAFHGVSLSSASATSITGVACAQ